MLLAGRERAFLAECAFPALSATPGAFTTADVDEFVRTYARPGGFRGATALYRSMLREGTEIQELAARKLTMPVLAVGGGSGDFTPSTMRQVATDLTAVSLDGIGHYAVAEAPARLADALLAFYAEVEHPRRTAA